MKASLRISLNGLINVAVHFIGSQRPWFRSYYQSGSNWHCDSKTREKRDSRLGQGEKKDANNNTPRPGRRAGLTTTRWTRAYERPASPFVSFPFSSLFFASFSSAFVVGNWNNGNVSHVKEEHVNELRYIIYLPQLYETRRVERRTLRAKPDTNVTLACPLPRESENYWCPSNWVTVSFRRNMRRVVVPFLVSCLEWFDVS